VLRFNARLAAAKSGKLAFFLKLPNYFVHGKFLLRQFAHFAPAAIV